MKNRFIIINLRYKLAVFRIRLKYWSIFKWIDMKYWKRTTSIRLQIRFYRLGYKFSKLSVEFTDRLGYLFLGKKRWKRPRGKDIDTLSQGTEQGKIIRSQIQETEKNIWKLYNRKVLFSLENSLWREVLRDMLCNLRKNDKHL